MEPAPEYEKTASLCESQHQLSKRFSPAVNEQCLVQLCASCPMLRRSLACSCRFQKGLDALPCLARTSGALQPATSRAMRMQATRLFHSTLLVKINLLIILIIIVIIVVVIVVVVIVCVINENSFDPCDGSTWSRKSKSVTKCNFCFKPVQLYGSRW